MNAEVAKMGSLLSRMTDDSAASADFRFTPQQVRVVYEVIIPRIATGLPGLPPGFRCRVQADDEGWTIRVDKPEDLR